MALPTPGDDLRSLLILLLRTRRDPAALPAVRHRLQTDPPAWGVLVAHSLEERVAPLLYQAVMGQGLVPPDVETQLQVEYHRTLLLNLILRQELGRIVQACAQAGLPLILLKGAALVETKVYPSPALRPMNDIDLLVRRETLPGVIATLTGLGYRHEPVDSAIRSELAFWKEQPALVHLDVHWHLFFSLYYQYTLPLAWFWQTARPVKMSEATTLVLSPTALLLHLCAHIYMHHDREDLLSLNDICEVLTVDREQLDWTEVLARAEACRLVLPLQRLLPVLAGEWGAPVPADILTQLAALPVSAEERRLFYWGAAPTARRFLADLVSLPDWPARLRYAWRKLFPPPAYMRECYRVAHPWQLLFYYPYRWLTGMGKS